MRYPGCILAIAFGMLLAVSATAAPWQVNYRRSDLQFMAIQEGNAIFGRFGNFRAEIIFDPQHLADSLFRVEIDTASVDTGVADRDDILRSADFFAVERWPRALFITRQIQHIEQNRYQADALLTIRGQERAVVFPFTLTLEKMDGYTLLRGHGDLNIDRFDYQMAQGDWADTALIGATVTVSVDIQATRDDRPEVTHEPVE